MLQRVLFHLVDDTDKVIKSVDISKAFSGRGREVRLDDWFKIGNQGGIVTKINISHDELEVFVKAIEKAKLQ